MKFAFLIMYELRAINKTLETLYKYVIDYYNADIILLCQKQFDDDLERVNMFNEKLIFSKLYDKPNPSEYFQINEDFLYKYHNYINSKSDNEFKGLWNTPGNLQIVINMNEMSKVVEKYINDYDYFIGLRSDIEILFPFPNKELFENIPNDIYGFNPNYCRSWGGLGEANFIHKKYIINYLTSCYDYIKQNYNENSILYKKYNIFYDLQNYFNIINFDIENTKNINDIVKRYINQEFLLLLSLKNKNIKIKNICNLNFYYTAEKITDYTTESNIILNKKYNVLCKYEEQLDECQKNLTLWNNNYKWIYENEKIILKKKNYNSEITILIPNYNKGEFIEKTLTSIFYQNIFYKFIIIIIYDELSSDNSMEIINNFMDLYPNIIKLFKNNIKTSQKKIQLNELVKTEYFTILDSEDYWNENSFLQNGIDFLENNKEYLFFANNTFIFSNRKFSIYLYDNKNIIIDLTSFKNSILPHTSSTIFRNINFKHTDWVNLYDIIGTKREIIYECDFFKNLLKLNYSKGYLELSKFSGIYRITNTNL